MVPCLSPYGGTAELIIRDAADATAAAPAAEREVAKILKLKRLGTQQQGMADGIDCKTSRRRNEQSEFSI